MTKKAEKGKGVYYLQGLLGLELDPDEVHADQSEYNKAYSNLAKSFGFDTFIDLFDYCMKDENALDIIARADEIEKSSKKKDTSKLVLTPQTSIRNGHILNSSYWRDPNGSKDEDKPKDNVNDDQDTSAMDAIYIGGKEFGKPYASTMYNSKAPDSWTTFGKYKKPCFDYIFTISANQINFMAGLYKTNDIIGIQYMSAPSVKDLIGMYTKLFSKVMQEAWFNGYGVEFDQAMFTDHVSIKPFCEFYQLTEKNKKETYSKYVAKPKQLENILGDPTCLRVKV